MSISDGRAEEMADWIEHELDDDDIVDVRPGPGRPPLPEGEALDEVLTIRVTAQEKELIRELAAQHDRTQSEEGRLAVQRHLDAARSGPA